MDELAPAEEGTRPHAAAAISGLKDQGLEAPMQTQREPHALGPPDQLGPWDGSVPGSTLPAGPTGK